VGDMADVEDLRASLKGIQRAYLCMPPGQHMMDKAMAFMIAAEEAQLESMVWMSQWLSDPLHHSQLTRETYYVDRIMHWLPNMLTTIVNPGWFADNYFLVLEPMAQLGIMPMPLGNGLNPPPSNEDMGRVVASILVDPEPHHRKIYRPTGPKLLSPTEIVEIIGGTLGRKVRYMDIPEKMFLKAIRSQGYHDFFPTILKYYTEDYRLNAFAAGGPTDVVERLTGRPPEDFETIAQRYVSTRPEARRTLRNKVKAIWAFAKILLTSTPDVKAIERRWEVPQLPSSRFATENLYWKKTHDFQNAYGLGSENSGASPEHRYAVRQVA